MPDSQMPGSPFGGSPTSSPQGSFSMNEANSSAGDKNQSPAPELKKEQPDFSKSFSKDVESFVKTPQDVKKAEPVSTEKPKDAMPKAEKSKDLTPGAQILSPMKPKGRGFKVFMIGGVIVIVLVGGVLLYLFRDSLGFGGSKETENRLTKIESTIEENSRLIKENVTSIQSLQDQRLSEDDFVSKADYAQDKGSLESYLRTIDTDSDGLPDYDEVTEYNSDPEDADTDNDGFSDGDEVKNGFNPAGEGKLGGITTPSSTDNSSNKTEPSTSSSSAMITDGSYVGSFSIKDVKVSSNDLKISVAGDEVTGSFTYEYESNPYRVDFTGAMSQDVNGKDFIRSTGTLISGSVSEDISFDMIVSMSDSSQEYEGVIEFTASSQSYLANQEGEVSFKVTSAETSANGFSINASKLRSIASL